MKTLDSSSRFYASLGTGGSDQTALQPGAVVQGRYRIEERLGAGPFSTPYKAFDEKRLDYVTLKVAPRNCDGDGVASILIHREFLVTTRIGGHQHVACGYDLIDEPGTCETGPILVRAYADYDLRQWLNDHRHDWAYRRKYGLPLLEGVSLGLLAAERTGVILLDVKPENVLLHKGVPKIIDVAVSRVLSGNPCGLPFLPVPPCEVCTPEYMSPEHFRAETVDDLDARSVVYSLGIMLYEMLHVMGELPFQGDLDELRRLHQKQTPPQLVGVDKKTQEFLSRCLAKDPHKRCHTLQELSEGINGLTVSPRSIELTARTEDTAEGFDEAGATTALVAFREAETTKPPTCKKRRKTVGDDRYAYIERNLDVLPLEVLLRLFEQAEAKHKNHPKRATLRAELAAKVAEYNRLLRGACMALRRHWDLRQAEALLEKASALNPDSVAIAEASMVIFRLIEELRVRVQRCTGVASNLELEPGHPLYGFYCGTFSEVIDFVLDRLECEIGEQSEKGHARCLPNRSQR